MGQNVNPISEIAAKISGKVGLPLTRLLVMKITERISPEMRVDIENLLRKGERKLKDFLGNSDMQTIERNAKSEIARWKINNNEAFADVGLYAYMRVEHWRIILYNRDMDEETRKWKFVTAFFLFALYISEFWSDIYSEYFPLDRQYVVVLNILCFESHFSLSINRKRHKNIQTQTALRPHTTCKL